jgi:hypothetical protein
LSFYVLVYVRITAAKYRSFRVTEEGDARDRNGDELSNQVRAGRKLNGAAGTNALEGGHDTRPVSSLLACGWGDMNGVGSTRRVTCVVVGMLADVAMDPSATSETPGINSRAIVIRISVSRRLRDRFRASSAEFRIGADPFAGIA